MEDAWDELGFTLSRSTSKLIGEIDCTSEAAEALCREHNIQGFPTLKFGDVNDLQDYEGPRDFQSLLKFSNKQLKPSCGINHVQLCDKKTRKEIRRLKGLTLEELDAEIASKTKYIEDIDAFEKKFVEGLEKKYEEMQAKKEADKKEIKESGLGLMKSALAARKVKATKENHDEL